MKKALIFLLCLVSLASAAQVIDERSFSFKGRKLAYGSYIPEGDLERIVVAFHNNHNSEWTHITWAQELTWFAEELDAMLVSPAETSEPLTEEFMLAFIDMLSDSLGLDQTTFFSLGNGIDRSGALLKLGVPGIIVSPIWQSNLGELDHFSAYSLLSAEEGDSALVLADSLSMYDQWVNLKLVIAEDDYYIDNYKMAYTALQQWNDSVEVILNDTNYREALKTALLSPVPDVLRQGQKLEIDLFVAENGPFTISLLNLSAKAVYEIDEYLGKGKHRYVIPTKDLEWGVYKLEVDGPGIIEKHKIMIRG